MTPRERLKEIECGFDSVKIQGAWEPDIEWLIARVKQLEEVIKSISSPDYPQHTDANFWEKLPIKQVAVVVAHDTLISREILLTDPLEKT